MSIAIPNEYDLAAELMRTQRERDELLAARTELFVALDHLLHGRSCAFGDSCQDLYCPNGRAIYILNKYRNSPPGGANCETPSPSERASPGGKEAGSLDIDLRDIDLPECCGDPTCWGECMDPKE